MRAPEPDARPESANPADRAGDAARTPAHAGTRPAGAEARATRAAPQDAPDVYGAEAAHRFVGRVAQLDPEAVRAVVGAWREAMRQDLGAWFAAEEAVARAVVTSGRHREQRPLLIAMAEAFARHVWYRGRAALRPGDVAPELRVGATEASGQYLGTLAMLALLVRDHLAPAGFARLYGPFAPLIPVADLGRE